MKTIPLNKGYMALVDDIDFIKLNKYKWTSHPKRNTIYATNYKIGFMHRYILNLTDPKKLIDHKDGNGLNNQRVNLRIATNTQNMHNMGKHKDNTSGYKGVSFRKDRGYWRAKTKHNGKYILIGYFNTPEEAAKAYDATAIRLFGQYARLNFPIDGTKVGPQRGPK